MDGDSVKDIAPVLLRKIQDDFQSMFDESEVIEALYAKVRDGTATYLEANDFAVEVGEMLSKAYKRNISSDVLPDGKMYYNIAQRIINPTMKRNYEIITAVTDQIQKTLNEAAHIGIKPITPKLNQDRIDGIVNRVSGADYYDDVAWILDEPPKNFSQSIVDDAIRVNAEFHGKSGMSPQIVRKLAGGCCDWCKEVAGTYSYPDVPKDVYRRHQRCRCTVDYDPRNGKVQNVHSKRWRSEEEHDKIEIRKSIVTDSDKNTRKTEYRKHIGENGLTYAESRALTDYVSSDAYVINDKLRRGIELTDSEKQFCTDLDNAIRKMPTYTGNLSRSLYFYSQTDVEEFVEGFHVNDVKKFNEYISTTKGIDLYNPDGQVQLYIQNSVKGHDLRTFNQRELEVLYERNSKFVVVSKIQNDGIWYLLLEEG